MEIELGGGLNPKYHPNIDPFHGDIPQDVRPGIPMGDGTVELIYSSDFFEHLTFQEGLVLLRECARVLTPTGKIHFIIPDMAEAVANNSEFGESMSNVLYGTRQHEFDHHRAWYSPSLMQYILNKEGWRVWCRPFSDGTQPKFLVEAWPNAQG